ncbi:unnamed protein product [Prunus brigantina]
MPQAQPAEDLGTVILNEDQPDRCMKISTGLTPALRSEFIQFLHHHSEATYPKWLANFLSRRIDQLVDATAGHALLSFMDTHSGYNQIFMHPADSEHTAFITDRGLYYYNVMSFGLKNARATY